MERKNNQKGVFNGSHQFSSPGIFGSLFSYQSPMVLGRESVRYKTSGNAIKETLNSINGTQVDLSKRYGIESQTRNAMNPSTIFKAHTTEPCNLCSSIYYGGQDMYYNAESTSQNALPRNYGENDDSGAASRGDWWKGAHQDSQEV